jgi:hypothetical protein
MSSTHQDGNPKPEILSALRKLTALSYKNYFLVVDELRDNHTLIAEILRVHLVSEFLLEELIRLVFEEKAEAILAIGLQLLPDFVIASLKKLNKLRNRVAHHLDEAITDIEIKDLFMGLESQLLYPDILEFGMVTAMKRYLFFIYGCMLPKFDIEE